MAIISISIIVSDLSIAKTFEKINLNLSFIAISNSACVTNAPKTQEHGTILPCRALPCTNRVERILLRRNTRNTGATTGIPPTSKTYPDIKTASTNAVPLSNQRPAENARRGGGRADASRLPLIRDHAHSKLHYRLPARKTHQAIQSSALTVKPLGSAA